MATKKVATKVKVPAPKAKAKAPAVKKAIKTGRPSLYTPELAAAICGHIADGKALRAICALEGMPHLSTIMLWLDGRQPAFSEQYVRAREAQADKLAEEILSIADDGSNDTYVDGEGNERTDSEVIQRSKLRVDARKWLASKMAPKKYGDKVENVHTGVEGGPIEHSLKVSFVESPRG